MSQSETPNYEEIGRRWFADSSLETWFPITADELTRLRSALTAAQERIAQAEQEIEMTTTNMTKAHKIIARAWEDKNWMLNNQKFLSADTFQYLDDAAEAINAALSGDNHE